jgi:cob(I)alamin adenosyltransferase
LLRVEDCRMSQKPRILIFTGDGKGKTTAALGMAFRASGHGLPSSIIQFIKSDTSVGEIAAAAASTAIEIHTLGLGFLPPADDPRFDGHRAAAQAALRKAAEIVAGGQFPLVVLDEICLAVARGLVEERQVVELVAQAAPETCLVLTGREAPPALIALADTVTEMLCLKHGLKTGRTAQKGVER